MLLLCCVLADKRRYSDTSQPIFHNKLLYLQAKTMNDRHSTKKYINTGQAIWLAFLMLLSYTELVPLSEADSFFFPFLFLFSLFCIAHSRHILPPAWHHVLARWLHPLTVRLRAFHIWQIRGTVPPPLCGKSCVCKNCGYAFTGNFCPRCGQSRYTSRYVLKGIAGNVLRTIFRVDGKFAHTLLELLYRPGYVMRDFIHGKRVKYTLPLAMVFLMTAFYMLTAKLIVPEIWERKEEKTSEQIETPQMKAEKLQQTILELERQKSEVDNPVEQKSMELAIRESEKILAEVQRQDSIAGAPQTDDELGIFHFAFIEKAEKAIKSVPFLANVWNLMWKWGHGNKAFHILLTLPLLAIATRWAFNEKKQPDAFNLMEHILIQAYIATQILLISTLVVPFNGTAHIDDLYEVPFWFIFFLFCWDYRQLYLCTWWRSFWKTLQMFTYCLLIIIGLAMAGISLLYWVEGGRIIHL